MSKKYNKRTGLFQYLPPSKRHSIVDSIGLEIKPNPDGIDRIKDMFFLTKIKRHSTTPEKIQAHYRDYQ